MVILFSTTQWTGRPGYYRNPEKTIPHLTSLLNVKRVTFPTGTVNNMSIFLKKSEKKDDECPDQLHFVPAKVNKDSAANVQEYFEQFAEEAAAGSDLLSNSLRGRPINGRKMSVPEGWQGVVYVERRRPLNDETDRVLQQKTTFNDFTYWNYDKTPSRNDSFAQAIQWLKISDVLHAPEKIHN